MRINEAGLDDLMRLPRVGPRLAERILESRTKSGPFRSLQDLRRVKGIGAKTAALIEPCVSFELSGRGWCGLHGSDAACTGYAPPPLNLPAATQCLIMGWFISRNPVLGMPLVRIFLGNS